MAKSRSGGGITSNKLVNVGVRTGKPAKGVSPAGAASIGIQRITTTRYADMVGNPKSVQLGNANAIAAGQGPGAGRTVLRAGSQQGPGPAAPMTSSDPLKGY